MLMQQQTHAACRERLWTKDYILILLVSMTISICNYFFFSTIPLYLESFTDSTIYAGIVASVYSISTLCMRPIIANLSDKYGRRVFLVAGSMICAVACLLYSFTDSFISVLCVRILHGIGFSITSTVAGAAVSEVCPESRTYEAIGFFGLYVVVSSALGPQIALSLVSGGAAADFKRLFLLAMCLCAAAAVFSAFINYKPSSAKKADDSNQTPEIMPGNKTLFGFEVSTLRPSLVLMIVYIAQTGIVSYLSLYAADKSMGNIGWFFTINALGTFTARVLSGRIGDRADKSRLLSFTIIAMAALFVLIGLSQSVTALLIIAFPLGAVFGLLNTDLHTMIILGTSKNKKGTASAAYYASLDIGYGVGGILMSAVRDTMGSSHIYFIGGAVLITALAVYRVFVFNKKAIS